MIKEGLWTIELMDGTIIQCTNNDDFKLKYNHTSNMCCMNCAMKKEDEVELKEELEQALKQ